MGKLIDLTGQQFGDLLVLERGEDVPDGNKMKPGWKCKCLLCGRIKTISGKNLRNGKSTSCGCVRGGRLLKNEIDNKYGLLTVVKKMPSDERGAAQWLCQCECGAKTIVSGGNLRSGRTKSCGCLSSLGERELSQFLEKYQINYVKQFSFPDLFYKNQGYPLRFDIAVLSKDNSLLFLIEYQGQQHYWNTDFGKEQREVTDEMKINYCQQHNVKLKIISYKDNIEEKINTFLKEENLI